MRLGSAVPILLLAAATASAQGRTIDEGTFLVTKTGSPQVTENFRIVQGDDGSVRATAQSVTGPRIVTSSLAADSVGSPIRYEVLVRERGVKLLNVVAASRAGRITAQTVNERGDESMREYPVGHERCVIVEDGLVHELYFAALGGRTGGLQILSPRDARSTSGTLSALGMEPVVIGGRSLTGTHYSLTSGGVRRDFWVDGSGRLLKVTVPAQGLTAVREEPPR